MSPATNKTTWEGLAIAEEIARWLGSDVIGCEHLLIAALRAHGDGPNDAERAASAIAAAKALQPAVRPPATADESPTLTPDAESALDLAADAARRHGASATRREDVIWAVREIREPLSAAMFVELDIDEPTDANDAFPWPEGELPLPWPSHLPGELPSDGPLAEFADAARTLARPDPLSPGRPWVLARGRRVVKAYDLEAPGVQANQRRAEADIAVHLSDLPGVVRTLQTGELGGWLVIEMERANNGLDRHLLDIESGRRIPLAAASYSEMFQDVAETLQELNDRGWVHRDIKPANLLFNDRQDRLLVADFSISGPVPKRTRRSAAREPGEPLGTDRYIAPEQFDGLVTPAVDQYSLGVTALDTFKYLPADAAVDAVLARATAWRPEDRFESVAEFGAALQTATDERHSPRLSERLERVKPEWRHSWTAGIVAAALTYAALFVVPVAHPSPQRILAVPIVGVLVSLAVRVLAQTHHGRTRPRLAIANQAWLAPLLAAPMIALLLTTTPPKDLASFAKSAIPLIGLAYGLTAWLGSTPPEAGGRLIALVRRWERQRGPSWHVELWWLVAGLVAAAAIWLPTAVYRVQRASATPPVEPANKVGYMQTLSQFRAGLLQDDPTAACRLVVATRPGDLPCSSWAPLAREALEHDLLHSADDGVFLGAAPISAFTVEAQPASGDPGVTIATASGDHAVGFGTFTAPSVIQVNVPRPPAGASGQTGEWTYEITNRAGRWMLTGVNACTDIASANCKYFTFMHK